MELSSAFRDFLFYRSPSRDKFVGGAIALCAIMAVVLQNQAAEYARHSGKLLHFLSIIICFYYIFLAKKDSYRIFALSAIAFFIHYLGYSLPYYVCLCFVFFLASTSFTPDAQRGFASITLLLIAVSAVVMILQVSGVGEWTQFLTTHGYISEDFSVPKSPHPTLFVSYYDLQANYLQGRPAGILHSNQFASLIVLFAIGLFLNKDSEESLPVLLILSTSAIFLLAKVVFLGAMIIVVYNIACGNRKLAFKFTVAVVSTAIAYAFLFPGLFQTYFFSCHNIWQSVVVRLSDLGITAGGVSQSQMTDWLNSSNFCGGDENILRPAIIDGIVLLSSDGVPISGYSALAPHLVIFYVLGLAAYTLSIFSAERFKQLKANFFSRFTTKHVSVALSLLSFSLAANFLNSPLFWLLAGLAIPRFWRQ
jgi:hypothetical protein